MARRANRPSSNRQKVQKSRTAETLEPRVVMSANPIGGPMFGTHSVVDDMPAMTQHQAPTLEQHSFAPILDQSGLESTTGHDPDADFWLGAGSSVDLLEDLDRQIEQNLREGHALTGQDDVVDTYGFKGTGQTVAVIDSGIAYSHFALGGGMGEGYRVVGGWDFTENDADFYDDGPSKSAAHGTHVAGIVGAAGGGTHQGVATDVDLVGLRVFDDAGNGYFSWVEQALQWVHTNRDAFDNPITAVNLSLGVEQNSTNVPGWSMLEDEFAQLEAAGIFISVSAGNSFTSYNAKGLSYPASSPHVIPVMASSNDGTLAPFSQRHESAIAAPGRWITSTVPDYAANDGDTIDDDYLSMSGTSMASPYVAGASVLIREAMEFARQDANHTDSWGDIDQWDIYNHMIDTAVTFTDSATSTDFKRLDLKAAIDAIMPEDDFGSTIATAHNLGTLNDTSSATPLSMISGSITTLDDADHFSFTAGVNGVVTISAANASHALTASWEAWGGTWSTNEAGDCVLEVVAGESYRVGLSSSNGLGYYDLDVSVESTFAAVEWGAIGAQETRSWQPSSNETWFAVTAGRTGYFTAETLTDSGSASVAIYDAQQNLIATAGTRADVQATAGETLMLRVTGDASVFDLRMTNALSLSGSTATMVGTDGEDAITFSAGSSSHTVSLNSVDYSLSASAYDSITIDGAGGGDTLRFNGTSASETAALRVGSLSIVGQQYQLEASGYENAIVLGCGGNDTATLFDGLTDDRLVARGNGVTLYAANGTFSNTAKGFSRIDASSSEGLDFAYLNGSEANDVFSAVGSEAFMRGEDDSYDNRTYGFDRVFADAGRGGADIAYFADTDGNDMLSTSSDHTLMRDTVGSYYNYATGFSVVHASSIRGGNDYAYLSDSAVNDVFLADSDRAIIRAADNSYTNTANGFDRVFAYSNAGGSDLAYFTDSVGDDTYSGRENSALMTDADSSYYNLATGFSRAFAYSSNGGHDRAHLYDSASADTFIARATYSQLYATDSSYYHRADGFDRVYAYAVRGGNDRAYLYGSAGADIFKGWSSHSMMRANDWSSYYYALGFDSVTAVADPGQGDFAVLYDSPGNDQLTAEGGTAVLSGSSYANEARGFDTVRAVQQNGGDDSASIGDDSLEFAFEQYGSWD